MHMGELRSLSRKIFVCLSCVMAMGVAAGEPSDQLLSALSGRGIWIQTPHNVTSSQLDQLAAMGVHRVHIMATRDAGVSSDCSGANNTKETADLAAFERLIHESTLRKMQVIVTVYVRPRRDEIDRLLGTGGLVAWFDQKGVNLVEFDLEGSWSRSSVCGYASARDAAAALMNGTRALPGHPQAGVTTHLGRASDPKLGMEYADWVSIQAYTKCNAKSCPSFDDLQEGPGHRQSRAPGLLAFKGPVVVGLAAYDQKWTGHEIAEGMGRALVATQRLSESRKNYVGHSYWSSDWIFSSPAVREFLRQSQ